MSTSSQAARTGEEALKALARQPGGEAVLALARTREDVMLVGGAVRDLLLGRTPLELDVTVATEAEQAAATLLAELQLPAQAEPARLVSFERFGTASVEWEQGRIDIAARRAESYPSPGALPQVQSGDLAADLARRDFTLNSIALGLADPGAGTLQAVEGGLEDLRAGCLRVLHERSFLDDPTRLLRLARYSARLGFQVERGTAELAAQAIAGKALETVSHARIGAELWLALGEAQPLAAIEALEQLGILEALGLSVPFNRPLAEVALALLPYDGSPSELLMAIVIEAQREFASASELLDRYEIQAGARQRILAAAYQSPSMAERIELDMPASRLREILGAAPVEAVALAGALAARRAPGLQRPVERWLGELRHVRLRVGGEQLLGAGVPQGPQIGTRLAVALDMKLDGKLEDTAEAELKAALEAPLR